MSFNRLNYDTCAYKHELAESVGPGEYQINTPPISCEPCFPKDPAYRLQREGAGVSKKNAMIDVDSELLGITRMSSKCPSKKFIPGQNANGEECEGEPIHNFKDCNMPTAEDTRTSNPPCNLRGTGWNRWEWLCLDPQERVLVPFDYNINNRLIVKDNHRPCVPKPIDVNPSLPKPSNASLYTPITSVAGVPTDPTSVHWRKSHLVKQN
jgi:hypothetical protein